MYPLSLLMTVIVASPFATLDDAQQNEQEQTTSQAEVTPTSGVYESPVVKTQTRRRRQPRRRRKAQPRRNRNPILGCFWSVFAPPGNYHFEVGLAGGVDYLETAYGDSNPNILLNAHVAFRPKPRIPLQGLISLDYSSYEQSAGPLNYTSRYLGIFGGVGAVKWIGGLRLNGGLGVGGLLRIASQTDGRDTDLTTFAFSPAATAQVGMGISLFGHVALSLQAQARFNTPRRLSYTILYGLDWMIDAKPVSVY